MNDHGLLEFYNDRDKRVGRLLKDAKNLWRGIGKFEDLALLLESKVGSQAKCHFYGTRFMQLGHVKSHLNIFLEVGKTLFVEGP